MFLRNIFEMKNKRRLDGFKELINPEEIPLMPSIPAFEESGIEKLNLTEEEKHEFSSWYKDLEVFQRDAYNAALIYRTRMMVLCVSGIATELCNDALEINKLISKMVEYVCKNVGLDKVTSAYTVEQTNDTFLINLPPNELTAAIHTINSKLLEIELWLNELTTFKQSIELSFARIKQLINNDADSVKTAALELDCINQSLDSVREVEASIKREFKAQLDHINPKCFYDGLHFLIQNDQSKTAPEKFATYLHATHHKLSQQQKDATLLRMAQSGKLDHLKALIEYGANPKTVGEYTQRNCLHYTLLNGHQACADYLMSLPEVGTALMNMTDKFGKRPAMPVSNQASSSTSEVTLRSPAKTP